METSTIATRIFTKRDWLAFAVTFGVVFGVYFLTLSSDIDLESSGIYATAAMHAGVGCPPGYPQWTLFTWLFVHALPVGNIAWRISLSSAIEGALASGLIALIGCKAAAAVLEQLSVNLSPWDSKRIAIVSGCVGAMAFAFSTDFWASAVTVGAQAFNILLFCVALASTMRWVFQPTQRSYLYCAFIFYGLTIVSGQSFIATAVGMQFVVVFGNRALGRDLLLVNSALLLIGLVLKWFGWFPTLQSTILALYVVVTVVTLVAASILVIVTRNAFSEWKPVFIACALMTLATLTYFIVPILSMTNPPVNWAYARNVEGFFHLLTRGQFERLNPTADPIRLLEQLKMYVAVVYWNFGWYYLPFAAVALLTFKRLIGCVRAWIAALFVLYATTPVQMVAVLNPSLDRQTVGLVKTYFAPGYVMLAILTAVGMAIVVGKTRRKSPRMEAPS